VDTRLPTRFSLHRAKTATVPRQDPTGINLRVTEGSGLGSRDRNKG
jgi:hypothetical protein